MFPPPRRLRWRAGAGSTSRRFARHAPKCESRASATAAHPRRSRACSSGLGRAGRRAHGAARACAPARARSAAGSRPCADRATPRIAERRTDLAGRVRPTSPPSAPGYAPRDSGPCSAASTIRSAISRSGKPSPARHSTTNGERTNGGVQSACGQSWTRTTGRPAAIAGANELLVLGARVAGDDANEHFGRRERSRPRGHEPHPARHRRRAPSPAARRACR